MPELPYTVERTVPIKADRVTVFRYFTDSVRWASWWGAGSTIDARPGGTVFIRYPNGVEASGEVVEVQAPEEISFTLGYASGKPMPPGSSRVTIRLEAEAGGTLLHLIHRFAEPAARDQHVQGWRYQLSVFSNIVANEVFASAAGWIDRWFEAWTVADDKQRTSAFAEIASPRVEFRDRYSLLLGLEDLSAHAGASLKFMPGAVARRNGEVRQCQGTAVVDWVIPGHDGAIRVSGTNVFGFGADGKIESVTGVVNPAA